jgi:hypothetical protein
LQFGPESVFDSHVDIAVAYKVAFYFHPTDEDLSAGTPERKKPLGCSVSVKSRIENAGAGALTLPVDLQ